MQIGGWTIWEENTDIYPWYQNFCCALIQFLNSRQEFRKKMKDPQLSAQTLSHSYGPPIPKQRNIFKISTDHQTS